MVQEWLIPGDGHCGVTGDSLAKPPCVSLVDIAPREMVLGLGQLLGVDEVLEDPSCLGLHHGEDVLVGVDGERRVGMTQALGDHLHRNPGLDQQGAVSVADVVESHPGDVGSGDDPIERLRERMGVYRLTFVVGEHPACRSDSGDGLFGLLPIPPGGENLQRCWGEVDAPPCHDRLASCLMESVSHRHEATVYREGSGAEVDVIPLQAEEFAAAQPGVGHQPQGREQAMRRRFS